MPDHLPATRRTRLYTFCRYAVAFLMCTYGFAKVFQLQFWLPASILDMPLGGVTGQNLVWAFYGSSDVYRWLVGLGEVTGGVLLLFRRTTLLGAVLVAGMLANIIVIDLLFSIDAWLTVGMLAVMTGVILNAHWAELRRVFWESQSSVYGAAASPPPRWRRPATWALRAAIVIVPLVSAYQGRPETHPRTPIDGRWRVASVTRPAGPAAAPSLMDSARMIYFEPEFQPRGVIRRGDAFTTAHADVDASSRTLRLRQYPRGDDEYFEGRYSLEGDSLRLSGTSAGKPLEMHLVKGD